MKRQCMPHCFQWRVNLLVSDGSPEVRCCQKQHAGNTTQCRQKPLFQHSPRWSLMLFLEICFLFHIFKAIQCSFCYFFLCICFPWHLVSVQNVPCPPACGAHVESAYAVIELLKTLRHPNIVQYHNHFTLPINDVSCLCIQCVLSSWLSMGYWTLFLPVLPCSVPVPVHLRGGWEIYHW